MTIPPKDRLTICFAHVAYQLEAQFERRNTGLCSFAVRSPDQLDARIGEADVLVVSRLWRDDPCSSVARKLRFIQSIGAGVAQFPQGAAHRVRHPPGERARHQPPGGLGARHSADPSGSAGGCRKRATIRQGISGAA